jgi:hypothetical protein
MRRGAAYSLSSPSTLPSASSGFTSAKIISPPHTMQRMTPALANLDTQQNASLWPVTRVRDGEWNVGYE